jgi:LysR family transcriptional regulator of abg operon
VRLHHVRHFLAVVDAGTLRAAAKRLGLTQPAITKSLSQLEASCGARLLLRTPRGVVLTPAGRTFLARARVIQAEVRRLDEELRGLRTSGGEAVAIGIAPPFSLAMPEAMARFRVRYPAAHVRIVEGVRAALLPSVRDEALDFAMGQQVADAPSGLRFRPLVRPRLVVACRKDHPRASARSLVELAGAEWIVFNPVGSGGILEQMFAAGGHAMPAAPIQCESFATALALAARSDALVLLFEKLVQHPIASRFLQRMALRETIPSPSIGIFQRADTALTPAASAMAQALTAAVRRYALP